MSAADQAIDPAIEARVSFHGGACPVGDRGLWQFQVRGRDGISWNEAFSSNVSSLDQGNRLYFGEEIASMIRMGAPTGPFRLPREATTDSRYYWISEIHVRRDPPTINLAQDLVLSKARAIVEGSRQKDYGKPEVNHARTAALWAAYLGVPITPEQVCDLNILQKVSRLAHTSDHEDSMVDIAGWAENRAQCVRAHREGRS